jgi:hypothetical protein
MGLVLEDSAGSTYFLKVLDNSKKKNKNKKELDRGMLTVFQSE